MKLHVGEHWSLVLDSTTIHIDTVITMWVTMAIIIFFTALATGNIKLAPSKLQYIFENIVLAFQGFTNEMGKDGKKHTPLLIALFLFIITANMIGQLPWRFFHLPAGELASPTNDINVTAALAIFVLFYYIISGVRKKGLSYFKHYFQPFWIMAPLNIMEDFVRPLTLALRLFANILAGEILIIVLGGLIATMLTPEAVTSFTTNVLGNILPVVWVKNIGLFLGSLLPLPIMFFELFVAFIQALVFTLLTSAYVQGAVSESH